MKKLIIATASLAALAGCATPNPNYYGNQAYKRPADPNGWQVVSVTPVPLGTGERARGTGDSGSITTYSSTPVYVQQQPVYGAQPVYVEEPVYQPRYYYPPISIGLGFNFGRGWGHHRGWGGSIGTRFPYHYRR